MGWGYTNSTGEYSLPEQPGGRYYIVVRIDGFKEYKERVDLTVCPQLYTHVVFMDADNDSAAATKLRTLIRGDGDFVRVTSASQLPTALTDLTRKIGGVTIVK